MRTRRAKATRALLIAVAVAVVLLLACASATLLPTSFAPLGPFFETPIVVKIGPRSSFTLKPVEQVTIVPNSPAPTIPITLKFPELEVEPPLELQPKEIKVVEQPQLWPEIKVVPLEVLEPYLPRVNVNSTVADP